MAGYPLKFVFGFGCMHYQSCVTKLVLVIMNVLYMHELVGVSVPLNKVVLVSLQYGSFSP